MTLSTGAVWEKRTCDCIRINVKELNWILISKPLIVRDSFIIHYQPHCPSCFDIKLPNIISSLTGINYCMSEERIINRRRYVRDDNPHVLFLASDIFTAVLRFIWHNDIICWQTSSHVILVYVTPSSLSWWLVVWKGWAEISQSNSL